jgi:hypothetical protein
MAAAASSAATRVHVCRPARRLMAFSFGGGRACRVFGQRWGELASVAVIAVTVRLIAAKLTMR